MEKLEDQKVQEEQEGFEPGTNGWKPSDIATRPRRRDEVNNKYVKELRTKLKSCNAAPSIPVLGQ